MNAILKWLRAGARRTPSAPVFFLCAVLAAGTSGCSPAAHYRENHDAKSLCAVLSRQVKRGDTMERIQTLLGVQAVEGEPRQRAARQFVAATQRRPKEYPDGVMGDDVFVGCPTGGAVLFLQFRQGKLINFDPGKFKTVPPSVAEGE